MEWLLLESAIALILLLGIVYWTVPKKKKDNQDTKLD